MKSIVHLINDEAVGGVNRMLQEQTRALASRFEVAQLVVAPRRPLPPRVNADVAIVHFTSSWSKLPFMTLLKAQRGDGPVIIVEHTFTGNFERRCVPNVARFRRMLRLAYRLADVVVAVSHGQARWMVDAGLVPAAKLEVIQPSVDLAGLYGLQPPERDPSRPLRLAAYGRYCPQKGFDVLVDAMRLVSPDTARLTLAGYGADEGGLRRAAKDLPHVTIGGPIEDLGRFLAAHDAVVVPSRWEAFGLVTLEARAAGRPVIASDADGLGEQIAPGHGRITAPEEPAGLAAAIEELAAADVAGMGRAAQASVQGHFDQHVTRWGELIERVGSASPSQIAALRLAG